MISPRLIIASLISGSLLSSCAGLTKNTDVDLRVDSTAQDVPEAWLIDLTTPTQQSLNWREIYPDPIMIGYIEQALDANYDILTARTRLRAAEANLRQSAASLRPRLDAAASASGSAFLGDINSANDAYSASINGSWNLDLSGQRKAAIEGSRIALFIQQTALENTRQAIAAATARAYINAVAAELQVDLAKTNLDFLGESRRISEARYRLGDTAKADFVFAEANFKSAQSAYENTRQSARAAKRALSILLGGFPQSDLDLAKDLLADWVMPSRDVPLSVLNLRPDIMISKAQIYSQLQSLKIAERAYLPNTSISGGISAGSRFSDLFDPADYIANIAAGLGQVLLDDGSIQANIDSATAGLDESLQLHEQNLRLAVNEIENAYDSLQTLEQTVANLDVASDAANESLRLESIEYDLGESSLLDILQVQTQVNGTNASLINSRAALIIAVINAGQATAIYAGP